MRSGRREDRARWPLEWLTEDTSTGALSGVAEAEIRVEDFLTDRTRSS
jgi:hypothetical protein